MNDTPSTTDTQTKEAFETLVQSADIGSSPISDDAGESARRTMLIFSALIIVLSTRIVTLEDGDKITFNGINFSISPPALVLLLFVIASYAMIALLMNSYRCYQAWRLRRLLWTEKAAALANLAAPRIAQSLHELAKAQAEGHAALSQMSSTIALRERLEALEAEVIAAAREGWDKYEHAPDRPPKEGDQASSRWRRRPDPWHYLMDAIGPKMEAAEGWLTHKQADDLHLAVTDAIENSLKLSPGNLDHILRMIRRVMHDSRIKLVPDYAPAAHKIEEIYQKAMEKLAVPAEQITQIQRISETVKSSVVTSYLWELFIPLAIYLFAACRAMLDLI